MTETGPKSDSDVCEPYSGAHATGRSAALRSFALHRRVLLLLLLLIS
jgi:hypothetical protein